MGSRDRFIELSQVLLATPKNVLDRQRWTSRDQLRIEIITWIERTSTADDASPLSAD